jgi:biotin carboxyl carrier protein
VGPVEGISQADLRDLLALVAGSDVVELEVGFDGGRLSLRRAPASVLSPQSSVLGSAEAEPTTLVVTSPLVGIFHPSVSAGDQVDSGQSIGAIEALGLPTSVDAPQGGAVEDLLVGDGQPVEYGQPLLVLRRAQ